VRIGLSPAGKVACLQPAHPSSTLLLVGVSKSANLFSLNELAVLLPFASVPRNFFLKNIILSVSMPFFIKIPF
jgi:hypothetical protein